MATETGTTMPDELRTRITAVIRGDLAREAAGGFPLLRRFPNSETAGVPQHFSRLNRHNQDCLLDALAHFSTLQWSQEMVREKKAHPLLGPYLAKQPSYPPGDWYGARPKKTLLKKTMIEALSKAGYAPIKQRDGRPSHVATFAHPDASFPGTLVVS